MPIAFPPTNRDTLNTAYRFPNDFVAGIDITNLSKPGVEYTSRQGGGVDFADRSETGRVPVNVRDLGNDYEHGGGRDSVPQWGPHFTPTQSPGLWVPQTDWADSNRAITGISRDSTGTILGSCVVKLFVSGSDQLIEATVSTVSGVFQFGNPGTGPFYIVAYKAGSPDVAGTTVNTLLPS